MGSGGNLWGRPMGETAPNAVLGEACSSVFRGYL